MNDYNLNEKEFLKLSKKGNLIPLYKEIHGDLETPVSAYYKIAKNAKYSFLLESVEGEEKIARYSFVARNPEIVFELNKGIITVTNFSTKTKSKISAENEDPLNKIRELTNQYKFVDQPGLPRFCGGLVGHISYDVVRYFERLPQKTKDDLNLPDIVLALAKDLLIFDHTKHSIKVVSCVSVASNLTKNAKLKAYNQGKERIQSLINDISKPLSASQKKPGRKTNKTIQLKLNSNLTKGNFAKIVQDAKKEIKRGEIIQVVLSQRFEVKGTTEPLNIYRALRSVNPSPYMYYLNFDHFQIIGSSPELLVRCENGVVETRPIAGTRKRGQSEEEDKALANDLLNDPKEKAEHIMLVDLGRNDLGRVCQQGTVAVSEFMAIEKYSHVMHIVSNVKGTLAKNKDQFDVLRAAFPAGTVSGAPKIRAMEIIENLEKVKRGPYAGCIAYFSFSGNLDSCITIRTILHTKGKSYTQAGAGIVADSKPEKEYQETVNKAKAQIKAIELAHTL